MDKNNDPADNWAQKRDQLLTARNAVSRAERELARTQMQLAAAEAAETEAWQALDVARRQVA